MQATGSVVDLWGVLVFIRDLERAACRKLSREKSILG
jgi:hypothetical protein